MLRTIIFILFGATPILIFSQNAGIRILEHINIDRNKKLDPLFIGITNSASPISLAVPIMLYSESLIKKDSTCFRKAAFITGSLIISSVITTGLKYSIDRLRPYETYPQIEKLTSGGSPSFPSGHTSMAFSTATSLSLSFPKWYVIGPSFLWAGAVGYSRMHLGVHYPGDVLAGALVGAGSAFLCHFIGRNVFQQSC